MILKAGIKKILKKKGKIKNLFLKKWWVLALILIGLITVYLIEEIPNPTKLSSGEYPQSSQILDRKGRLLFEIYSDKRRTPVELKEIPDSLKKATLAIEDLNFYKHNGFDFRGILRGLYRSVFQKRLQGGSTLTQQLVKNALLTQERTISRKIKEAILTVATEILYSKDKILEMYFNQTPYGGTIWGVQSAARGFFNKDVKDLDLAEASLIAGLPASPTKYSPFSHPEAAKARQEMVLTRMNEVGFISKEEMEKAKAEKLNYYLDKTGILAPHFVFYVKEQLTEKYGLKKLTEGGLKITTTLDLDLQKISETIVASEVAKLKKSNVTNGAALITEPGSGKILAMVGSIDYFSNDIDGKYNVVTALRQPGSSIKPLNYAVGLELGKITAASVIDDDPTCFKQINQKDYCPTNYGGAYHGLQTVRNSLANSLNIGAVKVLKLNGVETFIASASAMGITTFKDPENYGFSLTLGGGEVYMTDMATAYGVLANMGVKQNLTPILKVEDKDGKTLEEFKENPGERVLSRETSYIIQNILSDDGARSMVFGAGSLLNIKKHPEVAVKTGTTNDLRDNWTYGYTSDYVVGTWVGNNDNSKMRGVVSGTSGAAPIWNKIMTEILKDKTVKKPVMPTNIIGINVCNLTGGAIPEGGCESHYEYFNKEFLPMQTSMRTNVLINKDTGRIVVDGEVAANAEWQDHTVVTDIAGVKICLDCPLVGVGNTGDLNNKPASIVN
ncbi:MAG: PBP1A family penicillin-binding protein [Candidatus Shapirobacteria bacterium]|nr:PBP1A family penicillin-binding protein [Candidatus Shapirobacteria bacterium]MDD4410105.1 PBP1A family penicillin-binding protein [Candidatus Shapirobacteria bacterium]